MLDKKYNFKETEKRIQKFWEDEKVYKFDEESSKEIYSIDTPPPTISGNLHIGHIFSYTQAEMIARFHRMQGKNVFYPFGFDDNGLPTERLVEKELKIVAKNMTRSEFTQKCLTTTQKYEEEFKELWTSLGFSVDWDLRYETVSPLSQRISQKSFLEFTKNGKAYLKETPVLWCTTCQTSIAQAEMDFAEKETNFIHLPFMIEDQKIIIATTRPELLFGCVALFINPKDNRFNHFIGKKAIIPLYDFEIPILADEKVAIEKGTGVVMCATFGDATDLEWYIKHSLPFKKCITLDGLIEKHIPYIGELSIKAAREKIIQVLDEKGLLEKKIPISHLVAIHERCSTENEILPSKQWFIDILSEREKYLKAADEINWYPSYMKTRYISWVENLKWDWCISRQRFFGVPFPVWYCEACGEIIFADENDLPVNPLETSPKNPCKCGCNEFIPETAIFDTWATSSVTPLINCKWKEQDFRPKILPMSMRTQAHEIIRTWAFYTIVKSLFHTGQIPWKDIMVCGFVMAKKGEKISKSKDNSKTTPKALIEKYSADGLRYWAANAKLGTDTMFNEDELLTSSRFLTKLFNSAKFAIMHLQDFKNVKSENILAIDRWIIEKMKKTLNNAKKHLENYEIGSAKHEIDEFFWKDFCDNYLEIVKDRLYKPEIHGIENRLSAQNALYNCFLEILKMYAVFVPHITEEIYQAFFRSFEEENSIHKMPWNNENIYLEEILDFGEKIKIIINGVRKLKSEKNLSLKAELDKIEIFCTEAQINYFKDSKKDLLACTWAKEIIIQKANEFSYIIY